jgi:hypothetical protein
MTLTAMNHTMLHTTVAKTSQHGITPKKEESKTPEISS